MTETDETSPSQAPGRGEILITAAGREALEARLERLRALRSKEYADRLRDARENGDAASNDEYLAILEDEAVLDSQIARLDELLARAQVVDGSSALAGAVTIGSTVVAEDARTSASTEYRVVGSLEASGTGMVTASSPFGEALMGRTAGEVVEVELPNGLVRELTILRVEGPEEGVPASAA